MQSQTILHKVLITYKRKISYYVRRNLGGNTLISQSSRHQQQSSAVRHLCHSVSVNYAQLEWSHKEPLVTSKLRDTVIAPCCSKLLMTRDLRRVKN